MLTAALLGLAGLSVVTLVGTLLARGEAADPADDPVPR